MLYTAGYIKENYLPEKNLHMYLLSIHMDAYWPYTGRLPNTLDSNTHNLKLSTILCKIIYTSPLWIPDSEIEGCYHGACRNLQEREKANNIDIPISSFLIDNFKKVRLMYITNHQLCMHLTT
jgi:hypothetical protein